MELDGVADDFAQSDRDGVADQPSDDLEAILVTRLDEHIISWERLQDRSFAQRDRPVLLGMTEAAVTEAVELRRDGGRRCIPFHPTVHAGIRPSFLLPMAFGDELVGPIAP